MYLIIAIVVVLAAFAILFFLRRFYRVKPFGERMESAREDQRRAQQ